jgi:hypothetical protein
LGATKATHAMYRGGLGRTYAFRVRARDRAGNRSRFAGGSTIVPTSERGHGVRYRGPWRRRHLRGAFGGTVLTCAKPRRCTLTLRYRGRDVAVVGSVGRRGGRALVRLDGRRRTVDLYARRAANRRVVFRSPRTKSGRHTLTLTVLGSRNRRSRGHTVVVDGFAVRDRRG